MWPLWRDDRFEEGLNKRISVNGLEIGTGKHVVPERWLLWEGAAGVLMTKREENSHFDLRISHAVLVFSSSLEYFVLPITSRKDQLHDKQEPKQVYMASS